MKRRRARAIGRRRKWAAAILFVAGLALVGLWAWSRVHEAVHQDWDNWVFDRTTHGQSANLRDYLADKAGEITGPLKSKLGMRGEVKTPVAPAPAPAPRAKPAPTVHDGELLGRLVVPRLHVRAMVREGTGNNVLDVAAGHIPGTALPGQNGNIAVAAHRDTLFRGLRNIRKNDVIEFQSLKGDYTYKVSSTEIVTPKSTNVLQPGAYPEITLVTCYPFYYIGPAPDRFVVKARLVARGNPQQPVTGMPIVAEVKAPEKPAPTRHPQERKRASDRGRIDFQVAERHSRELAPGISIGVSSTDPERQRVNGWMWIMPDRRTIWLRDQSVHEPVVFYGYQDGRTRKLVITKVSRGVVSGYLLMPGEPNSITASN